MANQFNIRPPEDVAFAYGFDKSKIAQAAMNKDLDETSAVLAAMWLDAGERQKAMQNGQQPTVAQQVFSGQPPAAPAPAGLGATPQAAAMPPMPTAPQMGMPPQEMAPPQMEMPAQEMPMMAEGGMVPPYASGGGLSDVPVPDGMFDEPSNGGFGDGYAGGGMVAFAPGGDIDAARLRRALLMQESSGDYGATNAEGSGAMGAYQFMPPTARALAKRLGLEYRPDLMSGDKGRSKEGRAYQERLMDAQMEDILAYSGGDIGKAGAYHFAGPNAKGHGAKTRTYEQDILRRYSGSKDTGEMPERDINTAEGRASSREDIFEDLQRRFGLTEEEQDVENRRRARAEELGSDEYYEKQRKDSMWETLANIGFNMASSKSPSLLQAIGEAASAAMPGARADKKERAALKDRALDIMGDINGLKRKENLQLFGMAVELDKEGRQQEQFERKLISDETQSNLDRAAQIEGYKISAAGKTTDLESATQIVYESLVKSNEQGLLTKNGKPFKFAPEALKRQALVTASKLVKPPKPETDVSGALQLGGGASGSTVVDYGSLEQ